jgi:uncharacterized protein (TIGR00297 family)
MFWLAVCVLLILLGVVIYKKGVLDLKGTLTATLIGAAVLCSAGVSWFILLLIFLFMSFIATKYKYRYKELIKASEPNHGRRSAKNVLANGLVPASFALVWHLNNSELVGATIAASYIAAIATVAGDTLSSEIGVLSRKKPLLLTTFERVPPGTHGGVTLLGTVAGLLGAFVIGLTAWGLELASFDTAILVAVIGGTFGFYFDSFLGATFERRGIIGNGGVNFLSTIAGSVAGLYVYVAFNIPH